MWTKGLTLAFGLTACAAAAQDGPLSAIDWLSDSISTPVVQPVPTGEPPVTDSAAVGEITVTPLDDPDAVAVGLLPQSVTGLPADLWGSSDAMTLANLILANHKVETPAMQSLLETLVLAELNPPLGSDPDGLLLRARVDTLLDTGRVAQALALVERAGPDSPALVQRWLDAALLTGAETRVCAALSENNAITLTLPSRIFCLARGGDWNAAALTLGTARALGQIDEGTEALLSRFLDPELYEGEPIAAPDRITPLTFRMFEAIGEPLPTATLPRAFAVADLEQRNGWKAQLDAVERLARTGAVDPNQMIGIYTQRLPSASGGVWDRVEAIQVLETALEARDPGAVSKALLPAWRAMQASGTEAIFAQIFADRLAALPLDGPEAEIALKLAALSDSYETLVPKLGKPTRDAALIALARGTTIASPRGAVQNALSNGFDGAAAPAELAQLVSQNQIGEAVLRAITRFEAGMQGDPSQLTDALRLFRQVGLEDVARRAALQALVLGRSTG
ncbi:hypothetical protein [Cognatishimia sp. MH4019]|uniref:hypothetical protein n=1 Tax=Cognatishimia sp. MH4019 TaxID=2854030 RepID=UPI001CD7297C|nr:hypothetical protein [Cognatishimia sp. MH4019]